MTYIILWLLFNVIIYAFFLRKAAYANNNKYLSSAEQKNKSRHYTETVAESIELKKDEPKLTQSELARIYFNRGITRRAVRMTKVAKTDLKKAIHGYSSPIKATGSRKRGFAQFSLESRETLKPDFKMAVAIVKSSSGRWIQ
ncbi:MAG: hypothetical protein NT163_10345 [Chlorobiales bacterium]|nr:hypothetical protein [Chlorobiales bacterium]